MLPIFASNFNLGISVLILEGVVYAVYLKKATCIIRWTPNSLLGVDAGFSNEVISMQVLKSVYTDRIIDLGGIHMH